MADPAPADIAHPLQPPLALTSHHIFSVVTAVPTVHIKSLTYHPSIWPKMIGKVSDDAKSGDFVQVFNREGQPFGWGIWNAGSYMPLRIVSHRRDELDESFFAEAIRNAALLRKTTLADSAETNAFRAIHGDADFLPGLVADKFDGVLSLEITGLGAWQRLADWLPLLHESFGTQRVVVSVDPELARIERIPSRCGVASDEVRKVKIREHGIRYEIDFSAGHKTGFFCDQRENRKRFAAFTKGLRVLDLCCYSGGFSIHAAQAEAAEVQAVDLDERAISMAKRNANLNQTRIKFTHADVFTWIRTMVANGRSWDLVLADPPKFIHGRDDDKGMGKYADLNRLALGLVAPGGLYVTCSCSGQLTADAFERTVINAAHKQDRRLQIFD